MVVRAYDKSHRMMRARKQRVVRRRDDLGHRPKICGEHGISADVTASSGDARVRPPAQRDRLRLRLAPGASGSATSSSSTRARRRSARPTANAREARAQLPGRPARLPPAHHRGAAGREGQRARLRLHEQEAVGRANREQPAAGHRGRASPARRSRPSSPPRSSRSRASPSRTSGEADEHGPGRAQPARQRLPRRRGHVRRRTRRSRPGSLLKITGVGRNYSGTYRVAKAVHVLRGGGGYVTAVRPTPPVSTPCSASPPATAARERTHRLDRRRHRDQQQGPRRSWAA